MRNPTKADLRSGERTLDANALERSEVVANASMNRERNLAGPSSYEKELGFNPLDFLKARLEKQDEAAWLDLCCGTGRALIQAAEARRTAGFGRKLKFIGVDLVPLFEANGRGSAGAQIGKDLRRAGFEYIAGRRLLTCGARTARKLLPYRYLGADDQAGPNYTGQPAVDSYYEPISNRHLADGGSRSPGIPAKRR
jgi:SAM-dependent methyltransferase